MSQDTHSPGAGERGAPDARRWPERDRLRAILDSSLDSQVLWGAVRDEAGQFQDLVYLECNQAAADYLQVPREDLLGRTLSTLFGGAGTDTVMDWAERVISTGRPLTLKAQQLFSQIAHEDRRYDASMVKVDDGVLFTWRDVTDDYLAARKMRESEERLQMVTLHAPVALNLTAPDGSLLSANPAMCRFLGRDEAQLLRSTWMELTHPDDLAKDLAMVASILDGTRDSYRLPKRFVRPDGSIVWGDLSVSCVRDPAGKVQYLIAQIVDISELVAGRRQLAESRQHYRLLAENTSDVVLKVSCEGVLQWASPSLADTLGWERDEVLGRLISEFVSDFDWQAVEGVLTATATAGEKAAGLFRVRRKDGDWLWVDATASAANDLDGNLVRIVRLRDVDAETRARNALRTSEERFRTAMRATPIGMALIDRQGVLLQVNGALSGMLKVDEKALLGQRITSMTHPGDRNIDLEMWNLLHLGKVDSVTREKRVIDATGAVVWVQNAIAAVKDGKGTHPTFVAQFLDITQARQAHSLLDFHAHHDPLTDLKNRRAVLQTMHTVLAHPPRTGQRLGVLYCDLDRFKQVNDTYGHPVGDALLIEVARRIQRCLREADTVGRMGGDEFLVLLTQVNGLEEAAQVAEKVRREVTAPFRMDQNVLIPTLSIGVSVAESGDDADEVVARADRALYQAKQSGRDRVIAPGVSVASGR
ncbi:MAG: PAS domain S-box protein [Candidatus Nanopelagicales bacterium]|nr:PAS domain S-box protein [Candidatus Nanopelagicales bacterium]